MITVQGVKWYRPREVAKEGLIVSARGTGGPHGNYDFILRMIKSGRLSAKNYSTTPGVNYWLISEKEIERYNKELSS